MHCAAIIGRPLMSRLAAAASHNSAESKMSDVHPLAGDDALLYVSCILLCMPYAVGKAAGMIPRIQCPRS